MFSYVSGRGPCPRRPSAAPIRALVDEILRDMSRDFDGLYARVSRPSIPPERLLRAQLLQLFYSPQRAPADGAARLQHPVPVVRGPLDGRADLGADRVHR